MSTAFLVDGVRTPFGRDGGSLAAVRPDDLAAHVIGELVARHPADAPSARVSALVGAGHLGRRTGRGFYTYDDTGARPAPADLYDLAPKGSH